MPLSRPLHRILHIKLTRFLLVPSIIFVLIISGFFSYRHYTALKQQDRLLAESLARYTEAYIEDALYALKHLSTQADQLGKQSLPQALKGMLTTFPHFERLFWIDANNTVLAAYPTGLTGADFPLLFPQNKKHPELLLSRPIFSPESNKLTIYIGHKSPRGGKAVAELDLSALQQHLKMFSPDNGERTIVVTDAYGNVIVHPIAQRVRQQVNLGDSELMQVLGQDSYGYAFHKRKGLYFFSSMVRMPSLQWILTLSTSAHTVFYPIAQTVIVLIIFLIGFFMLMTILFRVELNKEVVKPLESFAAFIKSTVKDKSQRPKLAQDRQTFSELAAIEEEFTVMHQQIAARERELRYSRQYIRSVINSLPSVFIALDAEGAVTQWSSGAHNLSGITVSEAIGRPVLELLPQLESVSKIIREALTRQRPASMDRLSWETETGTAIYNLELYPLQDAPGRGAVLRMDNITTRMRLEEIMIQTEKMMSVGGLAAGMAHEINNPLGGILQGAQNILRRFEPDLAPNQKAAQEANLELSALQAYLEARRIPKMLDGIIASGKRAADIVSNMLNFSRKSTDSHTVCDLHHLIETVIDLAASDYDLKKRYDFKHIEIIRDYDTSLPSLPCTITEIEQVIFNLLKNSAHAIDAMEEPPTVPQITISTSLRPPYAQISITDNGPGIPDDIRSRIFEPFFTTKEVGTGTGLGLSVSYFIITNNHSGTFTVHSTPGQSTTFTISLPIASASNGTAKNDGSTKRT